MTNVKSMAQISEYQMIKKKKNHYLFPVHW